MDTALLLNLYRTMVRMRACEEGLVESLARGEIRCPVHLYSGQEAVATGVCASLTSRDQVFGSHRSHGHYLAKGGDLQAMVDEIFGRAGGCAGGRGGSMHLVAPKVGMLGAAPIVGGTISLAVGAAFAATVRGDDVVSVAFFGDGATGEGVFYESLNLAALRRLPMIFVCENNLYSTHLPIRECRASPEIYRSGAAFGVTAERVDGNDVLAVLAASVSAVAQCRRGEGPVLLECMTYRLRGHVGPDDNIQGTRTDIRPAHELQSWKARDPIDQLARCILRDAPGREVELSQIVDAAVAEFAAAVAAAHLAPFPTTECQEQHVYAH